MSSTVEESILRYETFINDVLKVDLKKLEDQLIKVNKEISDLVQQRHTLKLITDKKAHPNGFKTQINLGSDFFMEAEVTDTSKMLINIGLDHFVEFSEKEAVKYLDKMIKAYEKKAEEIHSKATEVKVRIKLMTMGVDDLMNKGDKPYLQSLK